MARGSITPMDFEWDNRTGPIDRESPLITAASAARKRPHSVLDSPSKSAFHTPNRPQLREPHSEHFLFSQQKPLTAVPAHVQNSTWEPRTPSNTFDFSSGGETPNTPPVHDSDVATPDTQMAEKMGRLMSGEEHNRSPKKNRRDSWMALKSMFSSSPSPAKENRRAYSTKAENRVMKRRSKNRKVPQRDGYDSDDPQLDMQKSTPHHPTRPGYARQAGDFFTWVEAHPHLPSVLSRWFQLLVNGLLGLTVLYIIYMFYAGVQADISIEAKKHEAEIMREISLCHKSYRENRCDPETRVPAMESACGAWEVCMSRDPKAIARASVSAKTFAQIFNAFVQEFSYKSMIFCAIVIFGGFNLSNWAFGVLRARHQQQYHAPHPQPDFFGPPATPQRQPSGGLIDQQGLYPQHTPFHTPYTTHLGSKSLPALPSIPDGSNDLIDRERGTGKEKVKLRSPTKRRLFG